MTKKSIEELRDFALFTFKTYQDVINAAIERVDVDTVTTVAKDFNKALNDQFENQREMHVEGLQWQLNNLRADDNREEIESALRIEKSRAAASQDLKMARCQIFFGLSGRALQLFLQQGGVGRRDAANALIGYLPHELPKLLNVFASVNDPGVSERWGWHWWDFQADGEAHAVDTTSLPYRIFVVRALQSIAIQNPGAIVERASNEELIYLFEDGQVPAMLQEVERNWGRYEGILGDAEQPNVQRLRTVMVDIRQAGAAAREARLVAAALDPDRLQKFKENVVKTFDSASKLRAIVASFGGYHDKSSLAAPEGLKSWGYNQIDDKAAFIKDWHVSYGSWGEAYGRGLAQAETNRAFDHMINAASERRTVVKDNLIPEIKRQLRRHSWDKPVILQTLRHTLEYEQIRNREDFISRYRTDFTFPAEAELDEFIGVLKFGSEHISVFDVFVQGPAAKNRLLIAELGKFVAWDRYSPLDTDDAETDVFNQLRIKVTDLNADDERREKIMADDPIWLQEKGDATEKELFLRKHVVVNVYDKFELRIVDPQAAVCITVEEHRSRRGEPNESDEA